MAIFLGIIFSFFILCSSSAPLPPTSEPDILLTFKDSIQDSKKSLSDWSNTTTIHYCNWTGVTCSTTYPQTVTSIYLQSFNLSGEISPLICKLSNLAHLDLANNIFNQPIPLHLSQCASLETLNLSNNLIWGTIPEQISQFSSLKVLDLSRNHIEGKIPESIGLLKNLEVLNFASNLLSGNVPTVVGNFTELKALDLSQNSFLVSEIPAGLSKLVKLEQLLLQGSGFYGEIPDIFEGLVKLSILDFSQNNLTGRLPIISQSLPKLLSFDVSQNKLSGSFPIGICGNKIMVSLSLHTNFLNGTIPNESINECINLEKFQVQNNMFSGNFPSWFWTLPKLKLIRAENNRLSGEIPDSISKAIELEQVQIDNNSFSSRLPNGLGQLRNLYRFSASQNGLYGELPQSICDSPVMSIINLSHNFLSGEIPAFKNCRKLVSLSLADNSLVGKIPESLSELPVLTYIDLSHNNLTGLIPPQLQNLKLALFNVSFNDLSGRVPLPLVSGLPASYLEGNPNLCGPGLPHACLDDTSLGHKKAGLSKFTAVVITLTLAVTLMMILAAVYMKRCSSKEGRIGEGIWRSVFFYPLRITECDLIMSMNEKSALGNQATFGRVYRVRLPSGELVAVKRIENFTTQSPKIIKSELKTLAKIRHKNIIKILGFCHSDESIFLIYEYIVKGSLGDVINQSDSQLPWNVRLNIAIGIAQGLAYLHKDYVPHLLHRNLKSTNILLDADFVPKITDFALDRVVGEGSFESTMATDNPSSSCYIAPEHSYSKKPTEEMDTYSFGVILLELVTGRKAESNETEGSLDVVKWVRRKVNISNGVLRVIDPNIPNNCHQEMLGALEIALHCTSVVPEKRPSMSDVVRGLQSLNSRTSPPNLQLSYHDDSSVPV
ncbi:transmembrane signal receptor [Lithospermum erythrorhizon]|uniref:Transmembrane signal receptor n=1 Tax=Lithospermum erythrorhizon TaxID=34254 RepID=A0AAV3QVN5_LITER